MQVGVFVPINNNGWLISENAPQYKPSFDLNKAIAQKAEEHGLDFLLSMIKLRGFGGKTEFWEYGLESFTLMAGLAAVTEKIKILKPLASLASAGELAEIAEDLGAALGALESDDRRRQVGLAGRARVMATYAPNVVYPAMQGVYAAALAEVGRG